MPTPFKLITAFLAVTGCAGLALTGGINPVMSVPGLALLPGYWRFLKGRPHAPGWAVGAFSVMTLVVFVFDSIVVSQDVIIAVGHLTITFQALKSFDLKEPWDTLQVYFMSLLQLIIASELSHSMVFAVVFIFFMIMLITAMVLSHFLKEGRSIRISITRPVAVISMLTFLVTSMIFIAIPRTSYKMFGKSHARGIKTAGFSERMDFGDFGSVKLDPTVIMRVILSRDVPLPLYWRGMTLDYFDGVRWVNSMNNKRYRLPRSQDEFIISSYDRSTAVEQQIYLEPIDSSVIFGLARVSAIKADVYSLQTDGEMDFYIPGNYSRRIKYTVYSQVLGSYRGTMSPRYLQLPPGFEGVKNLGKGIAAEAVSDDQKAAAIESYLKKNYTYSLTTAQPPAGISPIEDFLFNTKKGYCEHYSSSMVIMLRAAGIPARIVTGFYGGERNAYGDYIIVRKSDAHSWVEALINSEWRRFDPTPALPSLNPSMVSQLVDSLSMGWSRYVVGFSSGDQKKIVGMFTLPFKTSSFTGVKHTVVRSAPYFSAVCAALLILYFMVRKARLRRYGFITEQYLAVRTMFARQGGRESSSVTPGDLRRWSVPENRDMLEQFISIYEEHRFGQRQMSADVRKRYIVLVKELRKVMKKRHAKNEG